jgi:cell wall-associated NlpC family hydrolase
MAACATTSHPVTRSTSTPVVPESPATTIAPADAHLLMVEGAVSMLGQPYRYGGASPGGFDCSGLVVFAAASAGVHVPRTAAEQYDFGVPVARGDLQAGDLVFMHLSHKELHVAIALDDRRIIHAPSTGGYVRIDSLNANPYSRGFIGARRVIPETATAVSFVTPK